MDDKSVNYEEKRYNEIVEETKNFFKKKQDIIQIKFHLFQFQDGLVIIC